jgi:hypothetical protein
MSKIEVWTATVDDDNGLFTSVHTSQAAAVQSVLDAYDPDGENRGPDGDDLQAVMNAHALVVYIEDHTVDTDNCTPVTEEASR